MAIRFEWDAGKDRHNRRRHRVSFSEAATALVDPLSLTIPDPDHSAEEDRFVTIGRSDDGHLLVVVHTERGSVNRIISARPATRRERREYEEEG
jgi:uncharacterized DUF497 family protein